MLQVENIQFNYTNGNTFQFPNFELKEGEQSLLLGQSGCGKTTLLHIIAGFTKPKSGTIIINSTNVTQLSEHATDAFRGTTMGFVFQKPLFIQALNVKENIELAQTLSGRKSDVNGITSLLSKLGIEHKLYSKINALSEGEKQRVNIARSLIIKPKLILADEPTSALDDTNCNVVIQLLKDAAKEYNATLLVVTHDGRLKEQFAKKIEL
jgi:ABC-type lipoprotein export system ATPase subunit